MRLAQENSVITTVQFTYMMGVLWLICAGVIDQPNEEDKPKLLGDEGAAIAVGMFFLGLAHFALATIMLLWGLYKG